MNFRHLGINAVFLRPRMGGLETYTKELVPRVRHLRPDLRISVFLSAEGLPVLRDMPWASEVTLVTHPLLGKRGLRALSEMSLLGALAPRRGVDVLHSVALTAPLRTNAANVVTLADVTWLKAPDPGEMGTVRLWRAVVPFIARRADRIIAISEAGKADVVDHLRVPSERIDVVLPGFGTDDRAPPTPEAELRRAHGLGEGAIVLAVSAKKAHKNLARLLDAMAVVHDRRPDAVLVVPGNPTAHEQELREQSARLGIEHAIRFPAYVSNEDLEGLYRTARCFVFPSITEGFGLPVLEAQRRRVPVATSNTSSLPEAGGDGALYFDPYDVRDIARAVLELLENRELATRLVAAGERHVEGFTWERAAEGTLETYERAWTQRRGA